MCFKIKKGVFAIGISLKEIRNDNKTNSIFLKATKLLQQVVMNKFKLI